MEVLLSVLLAGGTGSSGVAAKSSFKSPEGVWCTDVSSEKPNDENDGTASRNDQISDKATARRSQEETWTADGPDQSSTPDGDVHQEKLDKWMWWQADARLETVPNPRQFLLTTLYEFLPPSLSGLFCALTEGRTSAINRGLLPGAGFTLLFIVQLSMSSCSWGCLALWLATRPDGVYLFEALFPMVLCLWRGMCIGCKYAYLAPSDLRMAQTSTHWSKSALVGRVQGLSKLFNTGARAGLAHHIIEALLKSVAFQGLHDEFKNLHFTAEVEAAQAIWSVVKANLDEVSKFSEVTRFSKYGNACALLGLDDLAALEQGVQQGRLPVSVVAHYFVSTHWKPTPVRRLCFLPVGCLLFAFLQPVVFLISGRAPFGNSVAEHSILGLRCIALFLYSAQPLLFTVYPPNFAIKRYLTSLSVLSAFGQPEARSMKLCAGSASEPPLRIDSLANLRAFWVLVKVIGNSFEVGVDTRYSSAFVGISVAVLLLSSSIGVSTAASNGEQLMLGVLFELSVLFLLGTVSVVVSALVCMRINGFTSLYITLVRRAALKYPEIGGVAKDVAADLSLEGGSLYPIKIMFMPATPALTSFFLSGIAVVGAVFVSALPVTLCIPPFLTTKQC